MKAEKEKSRKKISTSKGERKIKKRYYYAWKVQVLALVCPSRIPQFLHR